MMFSLVRVLTLQIKAHFHKGYNFFFFFLVEKRYNLGTSFWHKMKIWLGSPVALQLLCNLD